MELKNKAFTQIFEPKTIDKIVLPERIKSLFTAPDFELSKNYLLYGTSGLGKSLLAKLLCAKYPNLYINAPVDARIESVREGGLIFNFCHEASIDESNIKVLFLDELGRDVSHAFYETLKGLMDSCPHVKVVATTNFIEQIPENVLSRFNPTINFNSISDEEEIEMKEKFSKRINGYCTQMLKMSFDSQPTFELFIDRVYPDFRSALGQLQTLHIKKITKIERKHLDSAVFEFEELYKQICDPKNNTPEKVHQILMGQYSAKALEVLKALDSPFITFLENNEPSLLQLIPYFIIDNAQYQDFSKRIDSALAMKACVFKYVTYISKIKNPK